MNLLLDIGSWFAQNWMLLVLIVLAIAFMVPTYLRQKKESNARNELNNSLTKGTKIVTTAGVYGVVESIENTSDGKVVTIVTGSSKNPSTMTIHINAIMGIDNKAKIVEETEVVEKPKKVKIIEEVVEDDEEVEVVEPVKEEVVEEKVQLKKKPAKVDTMEDKAQPKKKSTKKD